MANQILRVTLLLIISPSIWAFNSDKCYSPDNYKGGWQFSGFTSSTQFTSSFGGCSAIGQNEKNHKFIVDNEMNLKSEIANGSGEYLTALNEVFDCPSEKTMEFNRALQKRTPDLIHLENESFLREITNTANKICFINI